MAEAGKFIEELRRRNVFRVAAAYAVVAWLLLQVASVLLPTFLAPIWMMQAFTVLLIIGFPIAVAIAWAFELTTQGIKRDQDVDRSDALPGPIGRKIDFAIIAVLSIAVVFFAFDKLSTSMPAFEEASVRPTENNQSIAVLPFENMSGDHVNNPFTVGVHDDLLTQLSKIESIKTISRTSVLQYRNTTKSIPEIASELDVATVLEGGVQRSGDRVRINVQLIDAVSNVHLWAETYDRQLTTADIFAIQTEIATSIASELRATLSPEERRIIASVPTDSLEAYEAYQLGRQALALRTTASIAEAINHFVSSTTIDPSFAQAWASLARSYQLLAYYTGKDFDELSQNAIFAANQAMQINDQISEVHSALSTVLYVQGDIPAALEAIKRALTINPNDAYAHQIYAELLHATGNLEQSLIESEMAARLDPLSPIINDTYAFTLSDVGRFDEALSRYRKVDEIEPGYPGTAASIGTIYGLAYGRLDLANFWYRKALALDPGSPFIFAILGLVFLELDDDQGAEYWIDRSLIKGPKHDWANGAKMMLESYRGDEVQIRKYAKNVITSDSRWRLGTAHSHGRVPDIRAGNFAGVLNQFELAYPELFGDSPEVTGANYRSAIDIAGVFLLDGDQERAFELLSQCQQQIAGMIRVGFNGYWVSDAQILALQGRNAEALTALQQAVDQGWVTDWRYFFNVDPNLDSIRDEPAFQSIKEQIEEKMADQLARTREMEANGELEAIPVAE